MAIPDPHHLLEQAEKLVARVSAGPPRQVDIRRAISAAYYAVFHAVLAAAADHFVGVTKRSTNVYGLVYRSIDHGWLRIVCEEIQKPTPSARFQRYVPIGGFGADIAAFAATTVELQEKRHAADYDPMMRVNSLDAFLAVRTARTALIHLQSGTTSDRETFFGLLLVPPRR